MKRVDGFSDIQSSRKKRHISVSFLRPEGRILNDGINGFTEFDDLHDLEAHICLQLDRVLYCDFDRVSIKIDTYDLLCAKKRGPYSKNTGTAAKICHLLVLDVPIHERSPEHVRGDVCRRRILFESGGWFDVGTDLLKIDFQLLALHPVAYALFANITFLVPSLAMFGGRNRNLQLGHDRDGPCCPCSYPITAACGKRIRIPENLQMVWHF